MIILELNKYAFKSKTRLDLFARADFVFLVIIIIIGYMGDQEKTKSKNTSTRCGLTKLTVLGDFPLNRAKIEISKHHFLDNLFQNRYFHLILAQKATGHKANQKMTTFLYFLDDPKIY